MGSRLVHGPIIMRILLVVLTEFLPLIGLGVDDLAGRHLYVKGQMKLKNGLWNLWIGEFFDHQASLYSVCCGRWRQKNDLQKMILCGECWCLLLFLFNACQPISVVIGHSMGGYLSVAYAEKYPQHVHRYGRPKPLISLRIVLLAACGRHSS